ncbi:hypothetical protein SAMN07250955_10595 [Arboricoccus pini]|uniref:Uncharacterized protein n=1 Tax=Arboricoccus pini TaxID=1963835 RepID=A0A212R308_9PROT|nr:hypothetical protein SAMN07250955_10595 [Arboricoccus pini]
MQRAYGTDCRHDLARHCDPRNPSFSSYIVQPVATPVLTQQTLDMEVGFHFEVQSVPRRSQKALLLFQRTLRR